MNGVSSLARASIHIDRNQLPCANGRKSVSSWPCFELDNEEKRKNEVGFFPALIHHYEYLKTTKHLRRRGVARYVALLQFACRSVFSMEERPGVTLLGRRNSLLKSLILEKEEGS